MNKTAPFFVSCFALLLASVAARAELSPTALYPAPHFTLTNQDDRPFSDADLVGKTWVVDFVFTRCGGPCPMMTQKMVKLSKQIKSPDARFVSISVDPTYDRPAVLKQYAKDQGATDPRFVFLTGEPKAIYDLAEKGFKLTARPSLDGSSIDHDEHFLLIDGSGGVRGIYHSRDDVKLAQLVADATALTSDANISSGGGMSDNRRAWIARFPAINASLNAISGILLCLAMMFIQIRRVRIHAALMIAAVISSTVFLACYLTYHTLKYQAGSATTVFPTSPVRPLYLVILLSHTILAVVVVPLVVMTLVRAWRRQWDRHRRIAKPTFWIWLYVSATGVIVYWMLYHLAPRIVAQQS
ncbi:MAG: putative rane protein [Phycisphaerales bacterium]|nr:putative rane protein [Phycisphaerales bacterium]